MPRKRSAVHDHYKRASHQGNRKVGLVECIHCGHAAAGNNAARLLKHLQNGCWPASGPEDPALHFDDQVRPAALPNQPGPARSTREGTAFDQGVPQQTQPARPPPVVVPQRITTSAPITPADRAIAVAPFLLINATVKDTKDPVVSRLLAVPRVFTFRNLQRALLVAFDYKHATGVFDVTYSSWVPGRGVPPRRKQLCIFNDQVQRNNWHAWDELDGSSQAGQLDERYVEQVTLHGLLHELQSCKIVFHAGPWAHELDILGGTTLSSNITPTRGLAVCLSGQGHPVLETSDPLMWQAFKHAYQATMPSPTQKAYRMFYEKECPFGDPAGLAGAMTWTWDRDRVNRELLLLPRAPNLVPVFPAEAHRPVHDTVENVDEHMDAGTSNGIDHVSNGQYDQNNHGQHHPLQSSSYALDDQASDLEQLRYA